MRRSLFLATLVSSALLVSHASAQSTTNPGTPPDLVSYSYDEGTVVQFVDDFPNYVEDTIFAPNDDIFPLLRFIGTGLAAAHIEVDAISYGHGSDSSQFDAFFSVGLGAQGLPGTGVALEEPFEREADIWASQFSGDNDRIYDANGSGGFPNLGLLEPASTNIDALDMRAPQSTDIIYWSVSRATAENIAPYALAIVSGADLFKGSWGAGYSLKNPPQRYATANELGLTATDDVDALVVIESEGDGVFDPQVDKVYYSLVPGSTSLVLANVVPFMGASESDVFVVGGGSVNPSLVYSAAQLGILPGDNLDALDLAVRTDILALLASTSVPTGRFVATMVALLLGVVSLPWLRVRA